jgi:hypothetical protein
MTTYSGSEDSLEGGTLYLSTRKCTGKIPPLNLPQPIGRVHRFRLMIESDARIDIALPAGVSHCKAAGLKAATSIRVGDRLQGGRISGYSGTQLEFEVFQRTGGHKGSQAWTRNWGYARIDIPLRQVLQAKRLGRASG